MSFLGYTEKISAGDLVIVCRGYERMFAVKIESGAVTQVKGGAVHHDGLIGKTFGSKVYTSNGNNWVIVFHPTPELWTLTLPHRTQIIYTPDASMISLQLDLRPGSKVIESGTGSGGLSHSLARSVAPNGHLYTYEFHDQRAALAREEFRGHGLSEVVTLECRDVCTRGFGLTDTVDAVFLDLPNPWLAVQHAKEAIKVTGGRLCSFSPCIEQVQRTVKELLSSGFTDIDTVECLLRPFDVHPHSLSVPNIGGAESVSRLVRPTLSTQSLYTAQPTTKKIPGHTGFLTFATLPHKQ